MFEAGLERISERSETQSIGPPGCSRYPEALVVAQVALSLVLLISAGLMIRNVWRILHADVGFNTKNLTQMYIQLSKSYIEALKGTPFRRMKPKATLTIQGIEERLKAIPGVSAVSISGAGVLYGCWERPVSTEGPPGQDYETGKGVCYEPVSPGYFQMLGIPVLRGRVFTNGDSRNSRLSPSSVRDLRSIISGDGTLSER